MANYDFNDLMILDIANNHQGDFEHGMNIIKSLGEITNRLNIKAALKFQFRQLDTFIHPNYKTREDVAHIPRFFSTKLSVEDYEKLIMEVRNQGMIPMCTPFDEESVDIIEKLDIEIIKIASCSAMDIPLIERVASAKMPTVASTGGATINQIDHMVQIFKKNNIDFALHHCVSIYPTPDEKLQLNQIDNLRNRYKGISIGWSTHEDPDDLITVKMALAKGATLFERHVGLEDRGHKLNKYSSSPSQVEEWLKSFLDAKIVLGSQNRAPSSSEEQEALATLMRGVYVKNKIKKGDRIKRSDVFFAMPLETNGLTSGSWRDNLIADKDYKSNDILSNDLSKQELTDEMIVNEIMLQVIGMLNDARISVGKDSSIEISHHYGLSRFREFGAVLIDVINRDYCKKIIIQLPRQKHPYHFHKRKEETFQILSGSLEVEKDGNPIHLNEGDIFLVEPGHYHKFSTLEGVIFEEVSTTHYNDDSFYQDEYIAKLPREARKTKVENWEI
jgi:sialic acid synthase SpsE/mannose-6-phosphate isomerase-like protein (cupin superfamily)